MNRTGILAGALSVLLCLGLLSGCRKPEPLNPTSVTTTAPKPQPEPEDFTSVKVETEYGTLYFDEQWADCMQTQQTMEGTNLTVTFQGVINQKAYSLFHVLIGDADLEPVGQLTADDGTARNVYIIVEDTVEFPDLTVEEQNLLYAMLEDINHIIEKLK